MEIGRKIYYQIATGNVILDTREKEGSYTRDSTVAEDFQNYIALQGLIQSSVGVIQCDYGYELSNFATYPYHIDITKTTIDETTIVWDTANPIGATLAEVQASKIAQMNDFYNQAIYNTFASMAFDNATEETYACDATSQMRINGEVTMAMAVKAGFSTEALSWKNTSQPECVTWTADQILKLGIDLHSFVTTQTDNLEALTVYINSLTTVATVNAVTWSMTIPTATT